MTPRILVVDDEPTIRAAVCEGLRLEGFDCEAVADGPEALDRALGEPFDLVVLDLGLPTLSGTEVCRRLRAASDVPILVLSARSGEPDRVLALELGADDYLTKPFSQRELAARARAILRRRELDRARGDQLRVGALVLDLTRHEVVVDGKSISLTPTEFRVLTLLAREPGTVVSRRRIMEELWQSSFVGDQRAAYVHIANLRRKLESEPAQIVTVRGVGYKLVDV